MSRRVAYQRTIAFLKECTQPVAPIAYSFTVHDVPELKPVPRFERELQRRFGGRVGGHVGIEESQVEEALDFLDEIDPQPTNRWGMAPVWFRVASQFRILDPATGVPLPNQDPIRFAGVEYAWRVPLGSSGLRLILHDQAAIATELCIPDAREEVLGRTVPWLQQHLPFKLSSKHWRAWTPTKSGSFKARKMAAPAT
jgi:hypothetical protein